MGWGLGALRASDVVPAQSRLIRRHSLRVAPDEEHAQAIEGRSCGMGPRRNTPLLTNLRAGNGPDPLVAILGEWPRPWRAGLRLHDQLLSTEVFALLEEM